MKADDAIRKLENLRETARHLQRVDRFSPDFKKWKRDTQITIEKIFGKDSRNINDFNEIRFRLGAYSASIPDYGFQEAYVRDLQTADAVLSSMIEEIQDYDLNESDQVGEPDQLALIERICLRFHACARQLRSRHGGRKTLEIEDEYDVQDLLHAILRLHFEDIRPEEWTPSYAGKSSRMDFLLKKERIVIETKKTRTPLKDGKIGEELIIDRAYYENHSDCDTLVCFVYDPEGRIGNPHGLERDLEKHNGPLNVRVIVAPKT